MKQHLMVLSTDGGSREDCNIFYAEYILVKSDRLNFDEPEVFVKRGDGSIETIDAPSEEIRAKLLKLGYEIEEPDVIFSIESMGY